jgi:hypothetical protein
LNHERDERWAYVALAVIAVAYIVYRYVGKEGFSDLDFRPPDLRGGIGKLAKAIPYLAAPLFAVLSEIYRRRKARAMREEWDRRVREEGFIRRQDGVAVRLSEGVSGKLQGDVLLTRVALYITDKSWHREPTRLVFEPSRKGEPLVEDVTVTPGTRPALAIVHVRVGGSAHFTAEFASEESEAWESDLRRRIRLPKPAHARAEADREPEHVGGMDRY